MKTSRCDWCVGKPLYEHYHDTEWGIPVYDDTKLFEFLVLESAQSGLSWWTILQRREGYRKAFKNFDYKKVVKMTAVDIEKLMQDKSIIRNKAKIESVINNARCFMEIQKEFGSFSVYIWAFVNNQTINNTWKSIAECPTTTAISDMIAKDMKKRGFKFLGSVTIYAYMQACGLVNDHITSCFRYNKPIKT